MLVMMVGVTLTHLVAKFAGLFGGRGKLDQYLTIRYCVYRCVMCLEWPMALERHIRGDDFELKLAAIHETFTRSPKEYENFLRDTLLGDLLPKYSELVDRFGESFSRPFHAKYMSFFGDSLKHLLEYAKAVTHGYNIADETVGKAYAEDLAYRLQNNVRVGSDICLVIDCIEFLVTVNINNKREVISGILKDCIVTRAYLLTPQQWSVLGEKRIWGDCLTAEMQCWVRNTGKAALREKGVIPTTPGFA
jgi:hypothetical protein